ncbi:MAG: shikimate dehydrogenase [bacterium]
MKITAKNKVCMIIGDPVEHSLSPTMHNKAYEALGIDDQFVFVAAHVKIEDMKKVADGVRAMNIRGLTCTIPHKLEIMKYLDEIDPLAEKIGAVNTVVNEKGKLKGYNTDVLGAIIPLEKLTDIKDKKVAMIGSGGVGRAIAFGMVDKGADLKIYNLDLDEALRLGEEVGAKAQGLDALEEVKEADIIFNATPLGMGPDFIDKTSVPKEYINSNQIVFDVVYSPHETRLIKEAREKNAQVIHGIEMLLYQGTAQFELYTEHRAPEDVMRKALYEHFGIE